MESLRKYKIAGRVTFVADSGDLAKIVNTGAGTVAGSWKNDDLAAEVS
jgi:hypothetical protein